MIGSTIAHYRISAKLGEGGMGEVSFPLTASDEPDRDDSARRESTRCLGRSGELKLVEEHTRVACDLDNNSATL